MEWDNILADGRGYGSVWSKSETDSLTDCSDTCGSSGTSYWASGLQKPGGDGGEVTF